MLLIKGKHVFSMLCKMMKHLEVIFWGNEERHEVNSDCQFTGVMMVGVRFLVTGLIPGFDWTALTINHCGCLLWSYFCLSGRTAVKWLEIRKNTKKFVRVGSPEIMKPPRLDVAKCLCWSQWPVTSCCVHFQTPAYLIHSWVTSVTHEWISLACVWK